MHSCSVYRWAIGYRYLAYEVIGTNFAHHRPRRTSCHICGSWCAMSVYQAVNAWSTGVSHITSPASRIYFAYNELVRLWLKQGPTITISINVVFHSLARGGCFSVVYSRCVGLTSFAEDDFARVQQMRGPHSVMALLPRISVTTHMTKAKSLISILKVLHGWLLV